MIAALVLAAGRSHRMRTQKLLLPLAGRALVAHVVDQLLASPVDRVYVVIGEDGTPIVDALPGRRVEFVTNADAESEMLGSVRCGLRALPAECTAALVALGDQPGVTPQVVAKLVEAFRAGDRGIVVPTCKGKRGHPLLVAMRYRDEILTHYDNIGLRGLLEVHPEDVLAVEFAARAILEDLDVPDDYQRAAARFHRGAHH